MTVLIDACKSLVRNKNRIYFPTTFTFLYVAGRAPPPPPPGETRSIRSTRPTDLEISCRMSSIELAHCVAASIQPCEDSGRVFVF